MSSYAMDDEIDLNDVNIEIGDLSDQETSDVMEPARKVRFEIKKAEVRTQKEDNKAPLSDSNQWTIKRLSLQAKVGEDGVDQAGKSAGRVLFPDFVLAFNLEAFPERFGSEWWTKKARGPAKELFAALGFDVKALPKIDADFIAELAGRSFIADIQTEKVQEKTDEINPKTGKPAYRDTGEIRNKLGNFRAAE